MTRVAAALTLLLSAGVQPALNLERLPFAPRNAIGYRASSPLTIDGRLDEPSWRAAPWSDAFVDIEGSERASPRFRTRMKILWDEQYLYVAADLEEPDIWATFTARDSVIYQENDFEIFIDPDGDTHEYYELEINALNTVWDLMLIRPYRDGGPAVNAWDVAGLKTAVHVRGTLNRPGDKDEGWSVEIALPWKTLAEAAPGARAPRAGEQWRMNFSRVHWQLDVKDGKYVKRTNARGEPLPENNWVWSPHGVIAMHMPERWGYVQFSDTAVPSYVVQPFRAERFLVNPDEEVKWMLRRLYYRQAEYRKANGRYARTLAVLGSPDLKPDGRQLHATDDLYVITAPSPSGGIITLRQDGRVWRTESRK
jgi:hypothetical protein